MEIGLSVCMHIYTYVHIYMYIYIYINIKEVFHFLKLLTTLARFGNRGMLASDDTYVRLGSCQILAKTCMQISLDFLDVTYFPHND